MTPKPFCWYDIQTPTGFHVAPIYFERRNESCIPLFTADQLSAARQEAFEEAEGLCFDAANEYQQAYHGRTENLDRAIFKASEVTAAKLGDKIRAAAGKAE